MFFERSYIFNKKKTKKSLWGIWEILQLKGTNGEFVKRRIWPEQSFAKGTWQIGLNHVDAPWSKTNNLVKYFFPMAVHFISILRFLITGAIFCISFIFAIYNITFCISLNFPWLYDIQCLLHFDSFNFGN